MSTISAISTAFGKGGIAVIRISGEQSLKILNTVFKPKSGKNMENYPANKMVFGNVIKDGRVIDEAMAVFFAGPHSFTGEDSAELHIHGGILLANLVLEATFKAGAVQARPGEFTERAFILGKIGLSQAESIIDLIDAQSEEKAVFAARGAGGGLSAKIDNIYDSLVALISSVYAYIDYPDEDLTDVTVEQMKKKTEDIYREVEQLSKSYRIGKAVCEGISTIIVGKPNTGKSSFLNLMLGEDRAIVTDVAGTTRDTVEETVVCGKVLLKMCDTAGIHKTTDKVEEIGVNRAISKLQNGELVFALFDNSALGDKDDLELIELLRQNKDKTIIAVLNKSDLGDLFDEEYLEDVTDNIIRVSMKDEKTGDYIRELVESFFIDGKIDYDTSAVITSARQSACIEKVKTHIKAAIDTLSEGFTQDIAGMELELAVSELGGVDGRTVTDDVVHGIFSRFCVGK